MRPRTIQTDADSGPKDCGEQICLSPGPPAERQNKPKDESPL